MCIHPLDVIIVFDATISPPKDKLVVCISLEDGYFFRINSKPCWPEAVAIVKLPDHPFLDHDSFIECSGPVEFSDYNVEEGLRRHGIVGRIDKKVIPDIIAAVERCRKISPADKALVKRILSAR